LDDDEDFNTTAPSASYVATANELREVDATVPEVDEVGPDEAMEKVGEVMNIFDQVAIVRGLPSGFLNRPSDRALDSDTLLVFEDRKVMGYVRSYLFSKTCLTQDQDRSMKHLVQPHSHFIKSNSAPHFH